MTRNLPVFHRNIQVIADCDDATSPIRPLENEGAHLRDRATSQHNKNKKYVLEALKGIDFRFSNASNKELAGVSKMEIGCISRLSSVRTKNHIGIGLYGSDDLKQLTDLNNFLLFAPLVSAEDCSLENIFRLILSKWECEAIKKYLQYWEIDSEIIITDLEIDSLYLEAFASMGDVYKIDSKDKICKINPLKLEDNSEVQVNNIVDCSAYIVIAENKWKILRSLTDIVLDLSRKIIITTSSIEDCQIPPVIRHMCGNILYIYPKLMKNSESIITRFSQEFGYRPSIHSLLAYDATDIAIQTLLEAGPEFTAMKKYLTHEQFDTATIGKIGFGYNGAPYLIGRDADDLFEVKYVDDKGYYRKLESEEAIV